MIRWLVSVEVMVTVESVLVELGPLAATVELVVLAQ
jgi:hypothetical protein